MSVLRGGPVDGRTYDGFLALTVEVPLVDSEWSAAYGRWLAEWGEAWALLYVDHIPTDPVIPEAPAMPRAVYRYAEHGVYEFDGVER